MAGPNIVLKDDGSAELIPGDTAVVIQDGDRPVLVPGPERIVISDRGPPGPPGAGQFIHTQVSPATEWIVNHNKGLLPITAILSVGMVEMEALVTHVSTNQLRVNFSTPMAGFVRCV